MATSRTIKFTVLWDEAQAERGTKRTAAAMGKLDAKTKASQAVFQNFSSTVTSRMGVAGDAAQVALDGIAQKSLAGGAALKLGVVAGAAAAGLAFGKFAIDAGQKASALNEQVNGTRVTFRAAADEVLRFGEQTAASLGISNRASLQAANGFGGMLKAVGLAEQSAAEMSTELVQLAGDLASFKDLRPEDALEKLRSGLAGETEPLRAVGVFLNEAAVKAKAMELGLAAASGELSEAAKVQARYALILEQTTDAQGDFERTSDSLANQQRVLGAQWEDFQAKVGSLVLPALESIIGVANDVIASLESLGAVWNKIFGDTQDSKVVFWDNEDAGKVRELTHEIENLTAAQREELQLRINALATAAHQTGSVGTTREAVLQLISTIQRESEVAKHAAASAEAMGDAHGGAAGEVGKLRDTLLGTASAQRATRNSAESVSRAQSGLADRQAELNDLLKKSVTDTKEVETAQRSLEDAGRGLASAQGRVADAERELQALYEQASPGEQKDATLDVRGAELALERARRRLTTAQEELNEAQGQGDPEVLAEALLSLREAELGVEQSTRSLTRAQESQNEVNEQGKPTADQLRDAQNRLAEANRGVQDATRAQTDAQLRLNEAQLGDPSLGDQITKAKKAVEDAERGVRDAKEAHVDSTLRLAEATEKERTALENAGGAASTLRQELEAMAATYPTLAPLLNALITRLPATAPITGPANRGRWTARPMASGGIVKATPGGTPALLGEGGKDEAVIPLQNGAVPIEGAGSSGTTMLFQPRVTINAATNASAKDIAREVEKVLREQGEYIVAGLKRFESRNGKAWRH